MATGKETQLTTDGVKDYGYATDNAGWTHSDAPILLWSPDSKKIATFQQDQRKVGEMYLVPVTNGHPKMQAWKYPLVGDENVTMIERVVIDVETTKLVRLKMPPDQHRSTLCDDVAAATAIRLGRCAVERRWRAPGVRLQLARSQAGMAARGGHCDGRCSRGDERDGGEVLRERRRTR